MINRAIFAVRTYLVCAVAFLCCSCSSSNPVHTSNAGNSDNASNAIQPDDSGTNDRQSLPDDDANEQDAVDPTELPHFSFFVTSLAALQELSDSQDGFGGDLRFGETGPGAGLRGADKICATIAERSMPGSTAKKWRAFLSVAADENGQQVNAIDRVGDGPWYDRLGRLLAPTKADLLHERPLNGDPAIQNDLPNEDGIPNHQPDLTLPPVDKSHADRHEPRRHAEVSLGDMQRLDLR